MEYNDYEKNLVKDLLEMFTILEMDDGIIETEEHPMAYGDILYTLTGKINENFLTLQKMVKQCWKAGLLNYRKDGSYHWLLASDKFNYIVEDIYGLEHE